MTTFSHSQEMPIVKHLLAVTNVLQVIYQCPQYLPRYYTILLLLSRGLGNVHTPIPPFLRKSPMIF